MAKQLTEDEKFERELDSLLEADDSKLAEGLQGKALAKRKQIVLRMQEIEGEIKKLQADYKTLSKQADELGKVIK